MKEPIKDFELEQVTGGTVILSKPLNFCGFSTTGQMYKIKGDFKTMRNRMLELYDANETMSDADFDALVRDDFLAKGWI